MRTPLPHGAELLSRPEEVRLWSGASLPRGARRAQWDIRHCGGRAPRCHHALSRRGAEASSAERRTVGANVCDPPGAVDTEPAAGPPSGSPLRQVRLPGHRRLTIRHLRPEDGPGLLALFGELDEDDVYRRFFSSRPPPESFVGTMTSVGEHGGIGLVATLTDAAGNERMVGEASCSPLPDGDGELGITVAPGARGWLGPYLLDALAREAAAHGFPNLRADVLLSNSRMLAMLRNRGYAVLGWDEQPLVVRVAMATLGPIPSWPAAHTRWRAVVEAPGGRWRADAALRAAGFEVMLCPGPPGGWSTCPEMRGEPCPLASGADVVVDAVPGETGRALLDAHRRVRPSAPVCIELAPGDADPGGGATGVPKGASALGVAEIVTRLVARPADAQERKDIPAHPAEQRGAP